MTAAQQPSLRSKLDTLERSIADLSHPNLRLLLAERDAAKLAIKALAKALEAANRHCSNIHHEQADRHSYDDPCPVEARIKAALQIASIFHE